MAVLSEGQPRLLQVIGDNRWLLAWPCAPCQHHTSGQIKVTTAQRPGEMLWEEPEEAQSSSCHRGLAGTLIL